MAILGRALRPISVGRTCANAATIPKTLITFGMADEASRGASAGEVLRILSRIWENGPSVAHLIVSIRMATTSRRTAAGPRDRSRKLTSETSALYCGQE